LQKVNYREQFQEKDDVISKLVYWGFIDTQDMCRILDISINKSLLNVSRWLNPRWRPASLY